MTLHAGRTTPSERRHDDVSSGPLPPGKAWPALARCAASTGVLLAHGRVWQPVEHVGTLLGFADGSSTRVYRETRVEHPEPVDPCVLLVTFRLRAVHGRAHAGFERVSVLNTPLFAGFPGLVSKLWLAHDERGRYRGLYEWDRPHLADTYVRSLWRVLAVVSAPGSIDFRILDGLRRDQLLAHPAQAAGFARAEQQSWWRLVRTTPVPAPPGVRSGPAASPPAARPR